MQNFHIWLLNFNKSKNKKQEISSVFEYRLELVKIYLCMFFILLVVIPCFLYGMKLGLIDGYYNLSIEEVKKFASGEEILAYGFHLCMIALLFIILFVVVGSAVLFDYIIEPLGSRTQSMVIKSESVYLGIKQKICSKIKSKPLDEEIRRKLK